MVVGLAVRMLDVGAGSHVEVPDRITAGPVVVPILVPAGADVRRLVATDGGREQGSMVAVHGAADQDKPMAIAVCHALSVVVKEITLL